MPYEESGEMKVSSTSRSISVRLANRPLILGLVSAYAFLEAYRIVFSNLLFFLFSLYLKTLASRSKPDTGVGYTSGNDGWWWLFDTSAMVAFALWSGTTPTSISSEDDDT